MKFFVLIMILGLGCISNAQTPFDPYQGVYEVTATEETEEIGIEIGHQVIIESVRDNAVRLVVYDPKIRGNAFSVLMDTHEEYLGEGRWDSRGFSDRGDVAWHGYRSISIKKNFDGTFHFKVIKVLNSTFWRGDVATLKFIKTL